MVASPIFVFGADLAVPVAASSHAASRLVLCLSHPASGRRVSNCEQSRVGEILLVGTAGEAHGDGSVVPAVSGGTQHPEWFRCERASPGGDAIS